MVNPFTFGKIAIGRSFTNREAEQKRIIRNLNSHINTILISPRRWGKSSLMKMVAKKVSAKKSKTHFCFVDLFNIRTEQEFYETLARELLKSTSTKTEDWLNNSKKFFKRVIPKFNFSIDPMNDFSLSFDWKEISKSPEEVLNLPEFISHSKKINIVICLDEFQNISFFDHPLAFQKRLRACWQHHQKATYCLYGSKRHLMMELFENKSMPFYKFGDVLFLDKIENRILIDFIVKNFKKTKKYIGEDVAASIASTMENHPYFVQQLAYTAWDLTPKNCTLPILNEAIELLFNHSNILFQRETDNLTTTQINFLKALTNNVSQFSSYETIREYRLGTSANVLRIKNALEEKEIVDFTGGKIDFMDPLFKLWFKRVYMKI